MASPGHEPAAPPQYYHGGAAGGQTTVWQGSLPGPGHSLGSGPAQPTGTSGLRPQAPGPVQVLTVATSVRSRPWLAWTIALLILALGLTIAATALVSRVALFLRFLVGAANANLKYGTSS